ncbi:sensor histidine kinase [Hominenteromicrobium sp.]|uniref:sensor histidine kinase n=1 Tax=Hominenteromicrobium sp. TaxID=3073581 RepID=UPI003AB5F5E5
MKRLSLQWRITLMTVLLIGVTCVVMNLLLCSSGVYYMDTIADTLQGGDTVMMNSEGAESFNPQLVTPDEDLTIVVNGAQGRFRMTNWYITAAVTLLSGVLAYFVSGRALKPLRSFVSQVEKVQLNNLADMRINENVLPEFRQLSYSFNQMLERLDNAFAAQRQFTGNAAHELRTPLALMQAQLELFSAEHPDMLPETAKFLALLREQTERLTQMTKTLLEMSNLQQVARNEQIQLAPMVEEVFTDLALLAEKRNITLEMEGDGFLIGSDALIYRLLFNLTENAVKYNRSGGSVKVSVTQEPEKLLIRVSDTGCGVPEEYQQSIFQPFFRVDKSRSREYGGVGLGLSLVWEIANLHGGCVRVEESSKKGTTIAVELPVQG